MGFLVFLLYPVAFVCLVLTNGNANDQTGMIRRPWWFIVIFGFRRIRQHRLSQEHGRLNADWGCLFWDIESVYFVCMYVVYVCVCVWDEAVAVCVV